MSDHAHGQPLLAMEDYKIPQPGMDSPKNSIYKSRHISLQSRVESIAAESMYDPGDSMPDLPAAYKQARSRSYLLEPSYPRSYEPEIMATPTSPTSQHPPMGPHDPIAMSTFREICFVGVVAVSHLMTQCALGQALVPIDIIAESFENPNPGQKSWFIAGYSLTVGTFILISGRLGDILGHSRVFIFGYAWLGVWSCFAGFAVYPGRQIFFDVCRAMQGIGPALLMPNGLAMFGRAYPPGIKKNIVFSIFGALAPAGFVIGAAFGSFFAQVLWWPWAFWSYGLTAWALSIFAVMVIPRQLKDKPQNPPGFDFTGSLLGVCGLVLFNVAWNNGPLYGWSTPHVYFTLIIGFLCLLAFGWVESRAAYPIVPLHTMTSAVAYVLALIGLGWGAFGIWVFYSVRFLELIRHATPLSVAAQYSPAVICGLLAAGMTGFMLTHTPVSFVMMISMIAFCAGVAIAATQPAQQVYWAQMFISIVIMPFGMDMSFPAATVILSNHMPREHQGLAASLVNTVVNYSISIALGIAGTVEVNVVQHKGGDPASYDNTLLGIRSAWYSAIGLALLGVILGALFFVRSLVKEGWKIMDH